MELTPSFAALPIHFAPVFTAPTFQTFVQVATGWILSQRRRYITEVIFSGSNVGNGHWSRFHRFFSHASWNIDALSMLLARLAVTILAPGATFLWAVDDTLCRKRGLTLYGAGMHYDPLISSRAKCSISQLTVWSGSLAPAIVVRLWLASLRPAEVMDPGWNIRCSWPL